MTLLSGLRLVLVFSTALSMASMAGALSAPVIPFTIDQASGVTDSCQTHNISGACAEYWYPAGPAMNTLLTNIFTDDTAEFLNIQSASPSIDLTDSALPNSLISTFSTNPKFLITAAVGEIGYYEIEFHLANNFWGCNFSFGVSSCGVQIRQGITHMIDKNSFATNQATFGGHMAPIDNPVPTTSGGGLPSPNPCAYDASFPETGTQCVVGGNGGVAYHLQGSGAGANGISWIYPPGSPDLNAAAQHFVNAGVATGFNRTTSVLTGISSAAATNAPTFDIRNDNPARLDLGGSMADEICYLFTGSYITPCTYLKTVLGPITAFPCVTSPTCCLDVCTTTINLNWWLYTAAFSGPTFFDGSLYQRYNSRFVYGVSSIQQPTGTCDPNSVPTQSPSDYMWACDPTYDNLSTKMEFSPCITASGDPAIGAASNLPTSPGNGMCTGSNSLSAISAGVQAEVEFGSKALTLPVFERTVQYGYLNNGWIRVNDPEFGLPSYFSWLNAWNPAPNVTQTIRQGFAQTTHSVNPYIANTRWDMFIVGSVYDSLYSANPLAPSQFMNWMTISTFQESNSSLGYPAPPHTLTTYRFTLRPDLYFQDGRQVTSYDVAFSYLSLVGSGAYQGGGASAMTGITILQPHQFDISVNSLGVFTLPNLTGLTIEPGRYWTNANSSSWDTAVTTCTSGSGCGKSQYTLSGGNPVCNSNAPFNCAAFPATLMTVNPADLSASFDPIAAHIFVGSGPWTCGTVTNSGNGTCTPSGAQNPSVGQNYSLTRFGAGVSICQQSNCYFRSSSNAAEWIWSEQGFNCVSSFLCFEELVSCFNVAANLAGSCGHWQQGIGNPGSGSVVTLNQVTLANRFFGVNWVAGPPGQPWDWATNPLLGIGVIPPVLYEGPTTLSPAAVVGCPNGYDC